VLDVVSLQAENFQKTISFEYAGTICPFGSQPQSVYMAQLSTDLCINGFNQTDLAYNRRLNPGSMINDAKTTDNNNCQLYLVKDLIPYGKNENIGTSLCSFRLFLVATKTIELYKELFLHYGTKYWKNHMPMA
jgi:hypothetical protein